MQITSRDKKLFSILNDYGILKTSQITKMLFNNCSKSALLRRLNILEKSKLIKKIDNYKEAIWYLSHIGAREIGEQKAKKTIINYNSLNHDLLLSEIVYSLSKENIGENWQLEHILRSKIFKKRGLKNKDHVIVPDALFIIDKNGQKEAVAMELELHRKAKSRYRKIFLKYQKNINLFYLWYIVLDVKMGKHLNSLWNNSLFNSDKVLFLYSLVDDVLSNLKEAKIYQEDNIYSVSEIF